MLFRSFSFDDHDHDHEFALMVERREKGAEKHWRRERENGRKEEGGPSNGNKLGPTKKLNPDLNPTWIEKQVKD